MLNRQYSNFFILFLFLELEDLYEQDKFEILFEKKYLENVLKRLEAFLDKRIESSDPELVRLVSDLVSHKDLYSELVSFN